jgi:Ca-activated chloride channel family protein
MIAMSFAHPLVLFLLAAPAWLGWRVWHRSGRRVALPFDHGRQGAGSGWRVAVDLAESLPAVVLAIVVVILAGPQRTGEPKTKRKLTNIEFCVDVSASMLSPFGEGTRYDTSMKAINDFLDFRTGDAFGLTFFGNNVLHWVPLTSDTSAFRCAPPFMKPNNLPYWFGGTMIGKALLSCKDVLVAREEGDRMIILITDGMSFDLVNGGDEEVARTLKQHDITVYAVHISNTDVPPPIATVTGKTGGAVFNPGDPEGLKAVFQRIDTMRETKLEKTASETLDDFGPFCVAGLSVLGLSGLAMFGLRYTPW